MTRWSEDKVLQLIKSIFGPIIPKEALFLSDDAAIMTPAPPGQTRVVSTDTFVENIDFDLHFSSASSVGHRCMTQNLSDMAAMGAKPTAFVWSLCIPKHFLENNAQLLKAQLFGAFEVAQKAGLFCLGGDLTHSKDVFSCTITIWGDAAPQPLSRSQARPGDLLFLSRAVGASKYGLELLRTGKMTLCPKAVKIHEYPRHEIVLGQKLTKLATACIDISDSLAMDLHRLCKASGVGACIQDDANWYNENIRALPNARDYALYSGEEYALLFTLPKDNVQKLRKADEAPMQIGIITANPQVVEIQTETRKQSLPAKGFDHFCA